MMLNNRSEMFLGKTRESSLSFITSFWRFSKTPLPPLEKHYIEVYVKEQIKHDNLVSGHRLATGPTPWSLEPTLHISGYRPKTSINFIVYLFIRSP